MGETLEENDIRTTAPTPASIVHALDGPNRKSQTQTINSSSVEVSKAQLISEEAECEQLRYKFKLHNTNSKP